MIKSAIFHAGEHVDESDLYKKDETCPFCDSKLRAPVLRLQERPTVLLMKCENCNAYSSDRMPTEGCLEKYYSKYYQDNNSADSNITFNEVKRFALHIVKRLNFDRFMDSTNEYSILDYGGGDGAMSLAVGKEILKSHPKLLIRIVIVDYETTLVSHNHNCISMEKIDSISELENDQFDLIISSAVIEHIPYPRAVIEKKFDLLKKSGVFYARTPAMTPLFKIFDKLNIPYDFTYPGHPHDLGQRFWENFISILKKEKKYNIKILISRPSIVETSFRNHFFRTLVAYLLKFPWKFLNKKYGLVGGWEVFVQKNNL
ncbi:class I SAM-dependent methyltransferase [Salibacteraceae bacterium]|nr:class I SAM-dependent methyltransferase [Salibacteraceae bacterium]MDC1204078.1 class I SAM-dependent methyltransferase [Salibacteraceae bacterium]